jgi:glutathione peroxidase-family protein
MSECVEGEGSLYDFELELLDRSRNVSLSEYEGKVVMLVNTATY